MRNIAGHRHLPREVPLAHYLQFVLSVGKVTDSERNHKHVLEERRWRAGVELRLRRALRPDAHRSQELDKLYEEFRRNKSVDL
ncbi:MAG: hypothetical protein OET44_02095 [Gammaproteobacteria bacterium]|nr:hypothetical protein [Gammaproteobacteria bacterium]